MNNTIPQLGVKTRLGLLLAILLTLGLTCKSQASLNSGVSTSKTELINAISAFTESEGSDDPEIQDAFAWRSFRSMISSLNSPEHATWLIESINEWSDSQDQETISIMCSKIGELANSEHIDLLLKLTTSPIPDNNKIWAIEAIARVKNEQSYDKLKEIINTPNSWVEIEKSLNTSPPEAAASALAKSRNPENINFLLETLVSSSTNPNEELQKLAIKRAIRDCLLNSPN